MTTPNCTECKHCIKEETNEGEFYIYCDFDETWIHESYAFSDLDCDAFEQKLDDYKTEKSRA